MAQPLMPHATAAWLVENTSLTFDQIAQFCGLHILEVQAIADDTAATKLTGRDPIRSGELTHEEIARTVWPYVEGGRLKPVIDSTFPLDRAAEAHARMEAGDHVGKIVLVVAP